MTDVPLARELIDWAIHNTDKRPFRQYVQPWIKNASRKMARHTFSESLFYPAIEKYLVKNILNDYNRAGGYSIKIDKETRQYVRDRLGFFIIQRARRIYERGVRFK